MIAPAKLTVQNSNGSNFLLFVFSSNNTISLFSSGANFA